MTTLIVGIGSHQGDDQAGWRVAERLAERAPAATAVRTARTPAHLLDWLEGVGRLILCDACRGFGEAGEIRRWEWPTAELQRVRWTGSHDISLPAALQLAERLGRLPAHIIIWSVEADAECTGHSMSDRVSGAVPRLVEEIEREFHTPRQAAALQTNR